MADSGGKGDEGLGPAEALEFVDEMVELLGVVEHALNQHGVVAGHAAAFDYARTFLDEGVEVLFVPRIYLKIDEGLDGIAEFGRVDLRVVAEQDAGFLQAADAVGDGGGRKKDLRRDFLVAHSGVFGEEVNNFLVNFIELICMHVGELLPDNSCCVQPAPPYHGRCFLCEGARSSPCAEHGMTAEPPHRAGRIWSVLPDY